MPWIVVRACNAPGFQIHTLAVSIKLIPTERMVLRTNACCSRRFSSGKHKAIFTSTICRRRRASRRPRAPMPAPMAICPRWGSAVTRAARPKPSQVSQYRGWRNSRRSSGGRWFELRAVLVTAHSTLNLIARSSKLPVAGVEASSHGTDCVII